MFSRHVFENLFLLTFATGAFAADAPETPTQTLELREWFGVEHRSQVVEFALNAPASSGSGNVLDESGKPVPFQLLNNGKNLAIRTDLPANAVRSWRWFSKRKSAFTDEPGIKIQQTDDTFEISNELIALRLPTAKAIKSQAAVAKDSTLHPLVGLFNYGREAPRIFTLAPLQGVRLRNGTWTGIGPNALVVLAKSLTNADVQLLESGPLKAVVRLRYDFDKPAYAYGEQKVSDPGAGHLTVTITVFAGQPSILLEEETDLEEVWTINVHEGLAPDQARYCGHHATAPQFGRMPDGKVYPPSHERPVMDAIVDLQYERARTPSYIASKESFRMMAVWDPWIFDSGWYWQMYNSAAGERANMLAIFAGPASGALGAGMSGAGIFTLPVDRRMPGTPVAGIASQSYRRSPDARLFKLSRFSWGIFLGVKGDDLPDDPKAVPTVNKQMNLFSGVGNLTKLAAMKVDFPDPQQGYGGLYMEKSALTGLITRMQQGKADHGRGAYGWLYNAEPSSRALFDAWVDPSGAKLHAAVEDILQLAKDLEKSLVHGRGIRTFRFAYWQGGLEMMRRGLWIDQVLASDKLSAEERARVKAAACLFAYVLWDNDFVPMDNDAGLNLGTANMPQQQQGYRYFYALLLAANPDFAARARLVGDNAMLQVRQQINESGAHFGCPHYISAGFAPTLNTLMQLKQLGPNDPFKTEPRLAKFAEFYLNLLTPPEVRFPGKPRCYIALGDSSTEASPLFGQLGTAFRDADPVLSKRLMGAWLASGKPHSGFFGTTVMAIDERLPAQDPALTSATFPGYLTVLRSAYGTPDETAAWVVNGDFYRDHRHADAGNLVIYALGVPLSIHWGSIYSPQAPGAFYHSTVVPETALGRPWDEDKPPTGTANGMIWRNAIQESFTTSASVDSSVSRFTGKDVEWKRTVQLYHENPAQPVIVIQDQFEGANATTMKVLSLNLMARGAVQTPSGEITPEPREHSTKFPGKPEELPSVSPPFALNKGVSRLSFTGQFGVDFDVFTVAKEPQEALMGNWAVKWTQQGIGKWDERQHILRIRGTGQFQLVIVPYRAGNRPADLKLDNGPEGLVLTANGAQRKLSSK